MNRFRYGFTIVELLIVIIVIGILAGLSVVGYNSVVQHSKTVALKEDVNDLYDAQLVYITKTGNPPVKYDGSGNALNVLSFQLNKGNKAIVQLEGEKGFCVYAFNESIKEHADIDHAILKKGNGALCEAVNRNVVENQSSLLESTVLNIGYRIEGFKDFFGYVPGIAGLPFIGLLYDLIIYDTEEAAVYCRNDTYASYIQYDEELNKIVYYRTDTQEVETTNPPAQRTVYGLCTAVGINQTDAGFQARSIWGIL